MKVLCNLTREQATLYKAVVNELMAKIAGVEGNARRGAVLTAMMRLKQVCDHPALLLQDRSALPDRSGKLARLEEILDLVVANGARALVFTQFAEMGHPSRSTSRSASARRSCSCTAGRAGRRATRWWSGAPRDRPSSCCR